MPTSRIFSGGLAAAIRLKNDLICELKNCCCDYFHVTVTVPDSLRYAFRSNQKLMYSLLIKTASESLIQLADDPKHLAEVLGY